MKKALIVLGTLTLLLALASQIMFFYLGIIDNKNIYLYLFTTILLVITSGLMFKKGAESE